MDNRRFNTSITGKIIIAFLISAVALSGAYFVYKIAFREILVSTEKLAHPNRKLHIVNKLFNELAISGQLFKRVVTSDNREAYHDFVRHADSITTLLDTLQLLCIDNPGQFELLDRIHHVMHDREKVLLNYIRFRHERQRNNQVTRQLMALDSILSVYESRSDSLLPAGEERKLITTEVSSVTEEVKGRKGFLGGLFGKPDKTLTKTDTVTREEILTVADTSMRVKQDSILSAAKALIADITTHQQVRRKDFQRRESDLAEFEKVFNSQVMSILLEVEKEVIQQAEATHSESENVINRSVRRVNLILLFFFVLTSAIIYLILTDVTRSSRYRRQLEKAREEAEFHSMARQRFLSNMSHEIRTPLQSIIGFSEQALQNDFPDKKDIDAIHRSSEHLLQVVNEILDYSRITSGKFTFEKTNFNVQEIAGEVIAMVKPQADQKGLTIAHDFFFSKDQYVAGDVFRLKQILLNLLGNAIKFTDQGVVTLSIHVEALPGHGDFIFSVSDTGIGIPYEMQQRIFDQFEQAHLPAESRYRGTGLGLSIVKVLVEGQGGHIALNSTPGKGACFTFRIPYEMISLPVPAGPEKRVSPPTFMGNVWLVDDDRLILRLCSAIFTKYHIRHTCFESAGAVLDHIRQEQPSILLADIRLPVMNGIELARQVREHMKSPMRIIALTAQALPEERGQILAQGFDDILMKPFREADILAILDKEAKQEMVISGTPAQPIALNLNLLRQMVAEDAGELKQILQQYIADTTHDLELLQHSMENEDQPGAIDILHRLAGRTSQIGAKEQGAGLRKLEVEYRNDHRLNHTARLSHSIDEIKALISEIEVRLAAGDIV